ncbi:MAG TPA: hypothetical protein VNV37_04245 [Solirubrobacteraceae bacterium]|nr:hypothetical protein [Solirubrobacteraceae bacterium]
MATRVNAVGWMTAWRRTSALATLLGALTLALVPGLADAPAAPAAAAPAVRFSVESENPINDQGGSYHYRSNITSITPKVPGLSVEVLEFADRLLLRNATGKTVTVYGYYGEPYARVQPNGATELNVRAPAVYLNTNFYGDVNVPASASPNDPPKWTVVDRAGQWEWHDHRIHWMSATMPVTVKDSSKRTWIFNWKVPISVGTQRGAIAGELYWVPESSKAPVAAIVALLAVLLAGVAFVLVVRRRRARAAPTDRPSPMGEAW